MTDQPDHYIINVNLSVLIDGPQWRRLNDEILDDAHPAEPENGIMQPVPPVTAATVELDDLRSALASAIEDTMLTSLDAAPVVGHPSVHTWSPPVARIYDAEEVPF